MGKKFKVALNKEIADERGQAFILVLILLLLGSLLFTPLLTFVATGLKTGLIYEKKTNELYAADAGVQDAIWQIKYDHLETLFTSPAYSVYDYTTAWTYDLSRRVNAKDVSITIKNVWIPKNVAVPSEAQSRAIIEAGKLVVTGSIAGTSSYKIKVAYYPEAKEDLRVETLGIWLPRGFSYVVGSSNLEADSHAEYYSVPTVEPFASNQVVLWSFSSIPFADFPGVNPEDSPMTAEVTFQFASSQPGRNPAAVGWITTNGVDDIRFSWDADTRVYKIISTAGGTTVETYNTKSEIRHVGSAIAGDYRATGNSLMIDVNHDQYGIRDQLLASSDATVSDIPLDAEVAAAYLYWSAWRAEGGKQTLFSDSCSNFINWSISGNDWIISSARFRGHHLGSQEYRYLTMKNSLDLTSYASGTVAISWDQYESGTLESDDGLDFAFSADGGITWSSNIGAFRDDIGSSLVRYNYTIPGQYLTATFRMRFYLQGFGGDAEYCYIDNIAISVISSDTSAIFKIDRNQVYFDGDGKPKQGAQVITADRSQALPNYNSDGSPNGFSYACYKDVTALVRTFSAKAPDPAANHPGNGIYTVGDVLGNTGNQWSYAAWSLIIIYSSAETQGHQLYLYDKFTYAHNNTNIDFDNDGQPGGHISGFIVPEPIAGEVNAAKLTVFVGEGDECWSGDSLKFNGASLSNAQSPWDNVWNSKSPGVSNDGIDIDTFYITWSTGLLEPGDTSAQVDLPTQADSWNLAYIILSFRSETTTGGHISYLIR